MLILGLDPSLSCTGWGVVRSEGSRLSHVANGQIATNAKESLPERLLHIETQLAAIISQYCPQQAAMEEVFVNKNPQSTLKLAHARGVAMLALARAELEVHEYAARAVKKCVVGTGGAEKRQVEAMVKVLLPAVKITGSDAADALAVAITHAHIYRAPR